MHQATSILGHHHHHTVCGTHIQHTHIPNAIRNPRHFSIKFCSGISWYCKYIVLKILEAFTSFLLLPSSSSSSSFLLNSQTKGSNNIFIVAMGGLLPWQKNFYEISAENKTMKLGICAEFGHTAMCSNRSNVKRDNNGIWFHHLHQGDEEQLCMCHHRWHVAKQTQVYFLGKAFNTSKITIIIMNRTRQIIITLMEDVILAVCVCVLVRE